MPEFKPGAVVVRGREVMTLNYAGQWMAPGVAVPMPCQPDESWDVLRESFEDEGRHWRQALLEAWSRDSHAVRFNKAHDDLTPHGRIAKWIRTVEL